MTPQNVDATPFGCFQKLPAQTCHETHQEEEDSEQKDKITLVPTSTTVSHLSSEVNCPASSTSSKEVMLELGECKHTMSDETKEQGGREDGKKYRKSEF